MMIKSNYARQFNVKIIRHKHCINYEIDRSDWMRLVDNFPNALNAAHETGLSGNTLLKYSRKFKYGWEHTRAPGDTRDQHKADMKELQASRKELKKLRTAISNITEVHTKRPRLITIPKPRKSKTEATACFLWSDWHSEEIVKPETINWLNEYNPTICEERVKKLCEGAVKLTTIERTGVILNEAAVFLKGDFITGHIHDENKKTNAMLPTEAAIFVLGLLRSSLDYLKKYGGFKLITVRCRPGNHSRTTEKREFSTAGRDT